MLLGPLLTGRKTRSVSVKHFRLGAMLPTLFDCSLPQVLRPDMFQPRIIRITPWLPLVVSYKNEVVH